MSADIWLILALLVQAPVAWAAEPCQHSDQAFRCVEYVSTVDGDTFKVNIPRVPAIIGRGVLVRESGLDTPELHGDQPCERAKALKAKLITEELLSKAKRIDLIGVRRDKYFRLLAVTVADGKPLFQVLMNEGLAYVYDGGTKPKRNWCK